LFSNKSGSIKERTQQSTEMGSDQSAVRSLPCWQLNGHCPFRCLLRQA